MLTAIRTQTSELAAYLTDAALEVLHKAGIGGDSIEMEVALWLALTASLERESRRQRWVRLADDAPLDAILSDVVHRAALEVAVTVLSDGDASVLDRRLRPWVAGLHIDADVRKRVAKLFAPKEDESPRPLGRSGIVRKLRVTALN